MRRAILYVPAALRIAANTASASFDIAPSVLPPFSVPLTTDGTTITHYACCPDPGPVLTASIPIMKSIFTGSGAKIFEEWSTEAGLQWLSSQGLSLYVDPEAIP